MGVAFAQKSLQLTFRVAAIEQHYCAREVIAFATTVKSQNKLLATILANNISNQK